MYCPLYCVSLAQSVLVSPGEPKKGCFTREGAKSEQNTITDHYCGSEDFLSTARGSEKNMSIGAHFLLVLRLCSSPWNTCQERTPKGVAAFHEILILDHE